MEAHRFKVNKTAHYYTLGRANSEIKKLLFCCHGYGQLASSFVHKFSDLLNEQTFIIAPEGLSGFYWKNNQPGASWMTKNNRLDEIEDYANYLTELLTHYAIQMPKAEIILLGFSQGGTTVMRWINAKRPNFNHLIVWASDLPSDLDYLSLNPFLKDKNMHWVVGDEDEFLTPERFETIYKFGRKASIPFKLIRFKGKHWIDRNVLQNIVANLNQ